MKQIKILDIQSKVLNIDDFLSTINIVLKDDQWLTPTIIGSINLHALYIAGNDCDFLKFYDRADFCYVDGMPIIWMLNVLKQSISSKYRITVLDWHDTVFEYANKNSLTIGLLGGSKGVAKSASENLFSKYKNINFIFYHGYIAIDEIPKNISDSKIDILLVGMGMPKEEAWILENQFILNSKIVIPVGGYFDYICGKTYTPPRWSGKVGVEWLFRLASDPKRLGYRYIIEPWPVLYQFFKQIVRHKIYNSNT